MIYKYDKKELTYKPITLNIILMMFGIGLLVSLLMGLLTVKQINNVKYITQETRTIILNQEKEFTREKLKEYLLELNIKYPHIVMAQAEIETGHFKSKIFKENNNLFGMKVATKRPTTNKGEQYKHAYYNSWRESVVDYAFYSAQYLSDLKTEEQYLDYIRHNYAEDSNYIGKVRSVILKNKNIEK